MGLSDFTTDDTSIVSTNDTSDGTQLEHGDRLEMCGSHKYHIDRRNEEESEYFIDGLMVLWETKMKRWGTWLLREYSPDGVYKGPDPTFMSHDDLPPKDAWHNRWEDTTGDWSKFGKRNLKLEHECGEVCRRFHPDIPWSRCAGCHGVLVDAMSLEEYNFHDFDDSDDGSTESGDTGLGQFMGGLE